MRTEIAALLATLALSVYCEGASLLDVSVSPIPPGDEREDPTFPGGNPIDFFDAYSWKLFIALNWPAKPGQRGVPDETKDISDFTAPRVWETWRTATDAMPASGLPPEDWDASAQNTGGPPIKVLPFAMEGPTLEDFNQVDGSGFPVGSLVARNQSYVRYEITMNQKQYEHIKTNKLYLRSVLEELLSTNKPIVFPDQSIEIKAAWKEMRSPDDDAVLDRYYHVKAQAFNPETRKSETKTFGLIGFHIAQKTATRRQWTWTTFEHVDVLSRGPGSPEGAQPILVEAPVGTDPSIPDGGITPSNPVKTNPAPTVVRRFIPGGPTPPPETEATNAKWQSDPRIKNTVWRNYRLIKSQWPTVKNAEQGIGNPFPRRNVANITMESFQSLQESSCIQCHFTTAFKTDFAWFVSLRAFPVPPAEVVPGGNSNVRKVRDDFIARMKKAAAKAQE
jgi:hypothetical protein